MRRSVAMVILAAAMMPAGAAVARPPATALKLSGGPSSVNYGSSFSYTVSGRADRGRSGSYPPNLVYVYVLTSPSPRCPGMGARTQSNLRRIFQFHSRKPTQPLGRFSRTIKVTANGHAFGLCAYLLNFPTGHLFRPAAVYWKVVGSPAPKPVYTLTVSTSGPAPGRVTSDGSIISCGGGDTRCTHSYSPGTSVELFEESNPMLAAFGGWGGACSGTDVSCTVTMNSNLSVTAEFDLPSP